MRSENEKHYRLEDGSYVAAQYPTAVHYKDENGNWANIDNTLSFEESKSDEDFDGYTNNENSFSVKLANDAKDQLLRLDDGEGSVFMKLSESAAESSEISVENADNTAAAQSELTVEEQNEAAMSLDALTSKAEYADVMPGVDLEYTVMPDGVKEYIVVNEKLSDYEFSFELSLGDMYLRENDDNSISIMTADSEEKYIIPAPYMTDANDRYSEAVEYTRGEMKTVSTAIPFDDQYDDWQYVSAELNAPNEDLADNQVIQIYSITIGTLYKNNIGNAYFDNVELTPVN